MRQPRFERGTFGSGGGTGQRPPTLAVVVSSTYASRASASASQRRLRCYHRCYRRSPLRRCLGAATSVRASGGHAYDRGPRPPGRPVTEIGAARDGEGSQCGVPAALHQRVKQFLRVFQVSGVEPLREPAVDGRKQGPSFVFLTLLLP